MILKDILATAVGVGPNYEMPHQDMRDLLRLDEGDYTQTMFSVLEMYHTFPLLVIDYGSTKENDELTGAMFGQAAGGSKFDQWYNAANPNGKKKRANREGFKAFDPDENRDSFLPKNSGPQIRYNYYENGTWPGPRLAVMIVDELGKGQQYGTDMSHMQYGFNAKLRNWDQEAGEYQDLELTHLYIDGRYVPMNEDVIEAANDYAARLIKMIFHEDESAYDPKKALRETLDKYGDDVFGVSVWQARRGSAPKLENKL